MTRAIARAEGAPRSMLELARVWLVWITDGEAAARHEIDRIEHTLHRTSAVQACIDRLRGSLAFPRTGTPVRDTPT